MYFRNMEERVLTFEAALGTVLDHASKLSPIPREEEYVPLSEAQGRVLALEMRAGRDQPPFPRSTRDGYALFSGDAASETGSLHVVGSVRAGQQWSGPDLREGEAVEIMTGAPVPPGADCVLMVEHASEKDGTLLPAPGRRLRAGENIVPRGAEVRAGDAVLPRGRVMGPAEIAVAASAGHTHVGVFPKPHIAIIATGDELVELDGAPAPWQIHDSNSYALAALVRAEGGMAERLPIARDTADDLRERIAEGRKAGLLLLSGGVSMGKYDLVEEVLREAGAEFFFTGALIQPGKPVVFGRWGNREKGKGKREKETGNREQKSSHGTYFFGLPGNPVSTQVCFHLFVAPLLRALGGRTELAPRFVEAKLAVDMKGGAKVTRFLPAELGGGWDGVTVRVVGWQSSGDAAGNARGNCYAVLPAGVETFCAGETVRVLLR